MKQPELKKIMRVLKAVYAEVDAEAVREGIDPMSPEYDLIIQKVREKVLSQSGFTKEEYLLAKNNLAELSKESQVILSIVEEHLGEVERRLQAAEGRPIPSSRDIESIAKRVVEKHAKPPIVTHNVTNQIVKETVVEKPKTVIQKVEYDDEPLRLMIARLKIPKPYDDTELREYFHKYFQEQFKTNIEVMGMPDFRKLAMGLQDQINAITTGSGVNGSGTANQLTYWIDSDTLGALATASYPSLTELSYVKGVTSAIQTQINTKAPTASPTFTGTVTLPVGLTGVIRTDTGVVSVDSDVTDIVAAGTETAAGKLELATDAETVTGTDTARATTPANIAAKMAAPGAIGNTTASTGKFTSVETTGNIELGHASDTTLSRASAGVLAVEGVNVLTVAGGTLTGNITLGENTSIALDPAGSADGKYSGITVTGTGGATIAFGDLVTLDKDDSRWELVDISVAAAATGDARGILGMAVTSSTDGGAITVLLEGIIRADAAFPALTIGAPIYASTTGDIVVAQPTTTDHVIRIIGSALTADEMFFRPDFHYTTHT